MHESVPSIMQQLVEINTLLANAASRLWDLSTAIEAQHTPTNTLNSGFSDCLSSSLRLLDHTLNERLLPARLTLAKTHNQLIPPIMSLPEEILSSIFVSVVYDPSNKKYPFPETIDMNTHMCQIYRRVHSLLEVCTRWRNVGITCTRLWNIVPLSIAPDGSRRLLSTELSLQRARGENLYLVAFSPFPLPYFFEKLVGHWHRLSSLNIRSDHSHPTVISDMLELVIKHGAPRSISKLSLTRSSWPWENSDQQSQSSLHSQLAQLEPQLSELLHSLTVLRICNVPMDWVRVNFLERLVELWISNIRLHGSSSITAFLDMLLSAHGIRNLAILSMDMTLEEGETFPSSTISVSQLESLHLDSLSLNCLRVLLSAISPEAYYTTLSLREDTTFYDATYDEFDQQDFALLKARKIDRLIISPTSVAAPWDSAPGLRLLLESVPKSTSLAIGFYTFHANLIRALTPPEPDNNAITQNQTFPRLQTLEFFAFESHSALGNLLEEFKTLVRGHSIQRLIIECNVSSSQDDDEEEDELVEWLKVNIPEFYMCSCSYENPIAISKWQLWDV